MGSATFLSDRIHKRGEHVLDVVTKKLLILCNVIKIQHDGKKLIGECSSCVCVEGGERRRLKRLENASPLFVFYL